MDQAGAQPKLLLRRTETVVEKLLTNWVSICMYGYLRETVGESLFSLVSAIKQRINQGPVDAVTGKALYTLNEDWLLWQVSEFNTVKLNVFNLITTDAGDCDLDDNPPLSVEVLDCDTIGQTKEKIFDAFMNKYGHSQKFHTKDIDLRELCSYCVLFCSRRVLWLLVRALASLEDPSSIPGQSKTLGKFPYSTCLCLLWMPRFTHKMHIQIA
uniref:Plexin cytoplasmic RasGAP domain-containing protein n=1 Tax=Callorhinchus milii TaxID=7868 RepID=A0A4W3IFI4_CALMI